MASIKNFIIENPTDSSVICCYILEKFVCVWQSGREHLQPRVLEPFLPVAGLRNRNKLLRFQAELRVMILNKYPTQYNLKAGMQYKNIPKNSYKQCTYGSTQSATKNSNWAGSPPSAYILPNTARRIRSTTAPGTKAPSSSRRAHPATGSRTWRRS